MSVSAGGRAQAGDLRHRVYVQNETEVINDSGGVDRTASQQFSAWTRIQPLSASTAQYAKQMFPTATHTVTLRHDDRVQANTRFQLVDSDRVLHVHGVIRVDEVDEIDLAFCTEVANV